MTQLLAIFIGGGLGSLARFGVGRLVVSQVKIDFPLGTLLANILSCVVLGLAVGIFREKIAAEPWLRAFLVIGFCGGFSTFSTFSYETQELIRNQHHTFAIANIAISILFCVLIIWWLSRQPATA